MESLTILGRLNHKALKDETSKPGKLAQLLKSRDVDREKSRQMKMKPTRDRHKQLIGMAQNHPRYKSLDSAAEAAQRRNPDRLEQSENT